MPFYLYRQNNSGGRFDNDENVTNFVVIEAPDSNFARNKALEIGIYFDGVDRNIDCECCGDRWCDSSEEFLFPKDELTLKLKSDSPYYDSWLLFLEEYGKFDKKGHYIKLLSIEAIICYYLASSIFFINDSRAHIYYLDGKKLTIDNKIFNELIVDIDKKYSLYDLFDFKV